MEFIKPHEGLRLKAYQDVAGVWTIGYGHTKTAKEGMEIGETTANELLRQDTKEAMDAVLKAVTVPLNKNELVALTSFTFNLGAGNLRKSTLLRRLNAGESRPEVSKEFMRWNKAGGVVYRGLTIRRMQESEVFLT